jgi:DNA polymerase III epsilon subunit family exonuclease
VADDLKKAEFVIFDVETTGLSPFYGDRIVEIAALKLKAGKPGGEFHSLVNPQREISWAAFAVNHISPEMLVNAPLSRDVLPRFLEFCGKGCLVGYNVNFDLSFVNNELSFLDKSLPADSPVIDILKMSRNLLPDLDSHSLSSVIGALRLGQDQEHRALSDVHLTAGVFKHFLNILQDKGIGKFDHLFSLFGVNHVLIADAKQQKLDSIQQAIDLGVELQIKYFSGSTAEVTQRKIRPIEIKKIKNKDMVAAYCHLRKGERTFSLDRIIHLEML